MYNWLTILCICTCRGKSGNNTSGKIIPRTPVGDVSFHYGSLKKLFKFSITETYKIKFVKYIKFSYGYLIRFFIESTTSLTKKLQQTKKRIIHIHTHKASSN